MALNLEQIRRVADRVAASQGLDVVDIEYVAGGKQHVLRVFIEKNREERAKLAGPDADRLSGVTHEDCERFSRDFGTILDVEELVAGSGYMLEVSSPGLNRRLDGRSDYERFEGSLVKVQTRDPVAGNRHWHGRLTKVTADGIVLDVTANKQKKGKRGAGEETVEVALSNIEKANLIPEF